MMGIKHILNDFREYVNKTGDQRCQRVSEPHRRRNQETGCGPLGGTAPPHLIWRQLVSGSDEAASFKPGLRTEGGDTRGAKKRPWGRRKLAMPGGE